MMKKGAYSSAIAHICGSHEDSCIRGTIRFLQQCHGVLIEASITGLPRNELGFFGFHIHEGENCCGDGFPNTGGHYNPGKTLHPNHAGDLPPLLADWGKAYMKVYTERFCVDDIIGKTVVIHENADDFHTQPSGNAGRKIACGTIRRM